MITLRPYQEASLTAIYEHLAQRDDNPCVVIPTGGGKGVIVGRLCADVVERWKGRILVLTHVKELVDQNAIQAGRCLSPLLVGVNSAGLKRRDLDHPVIIAGIQSVYGKPYDLGRFDIILIDECHLLPPDGEGMYLTFIRAAKIINPPVRVIGLTATPFRLKDGAICGPDNILNHVCFDVGVKELIRDGYLSPLISRAGTTKADTTALHVRGGEFVADEVEALMDAEALVQAACAEIVELTATRAATLIFCASVQHAQHVVSVLRTQHHIHIEVVTGETPTAERDRIISDFKAGELRYLANVNVLTTGFDAPHVDCVVLLRPTLSAGLYYQMVGRGFRLAPGKADCLVLDYGGNVVRHGPVDQLAVNSQDRGKGEGTAPAKECPECHAVVAAACARCLQCGYEFPVPQREQHAAKATSAGVISGQFTDTEHDVRSVYYAVHAKRGADDTTPKTLRVEYEVGWNKWIKEWVCIEHQGFARRKAELWWADRCELPCPTTAAEAVDLSSRGKIAEPSHVTVRETAGEDFPRIITYRLKEKPSAREPGSDEDEPMPVNTWSDFDDEPPF